MPLNAARLAGDARLRDLIKSLPGKRPVLAATAAALTLVSVWGCEHANSGALMALAAPAGMFVQPAKPGPSPARLEGDAAGGSNVAIILNSGDGSISLVDRNRYAEVSRFPVGKEPHHLMAEANDKDLIVANAVSNELVFLNPHSGQIERRLPHISDPYQIGFSPDGKWFVSASLRLDRVDVYHARDFSLAKRYELRSAPSHLAFNADSSMVFVTLQDSNKVAAIDLVKQEVCWTIPVGPQPAGIWMTPDNQFLFAGIMGSNYVEIIDWRARTSVARLATGAGAHQFLHVAGTNHVLVSNRVAGTVTVVDFKQRRVLGQMPVPGGPDCMILTRDQKQLWVTSRWIKRVSVVDMATGQVVHSIPVGHSPHGVYLFDHAPLL